MKKKILYVFVIGAIIIELIMIALMTSSLKFKEVQVYVSNKIENVIEVPDEEIQSIVEEIPDAEIYIPAKYEKLVLELCEKYKIPLAVFTKLIQSESRWREKVSRTNYYYLKDGTRKVHSYDKGIAQLNTNNYEEFTWRFNNDIPVDPFNYEMSLTIAAKYLNWLYVRTGNWYDVICAYKSGITKVRENRVPEHIEVLSLAVVDPKISALDVKYFP